MQHTRFGEVPVRWYDVYTSVSRAEQIQETEERRSFRERLRKPGVGGWGGIEAELPGCESGRHMMCTSALSYIPYRAADQQ